MASCGPTKLDQVVAGTAVEWDQDFSADSAAPVGSEWKPDQVAVQADLAGLVRGQMLRGHQYRVAGNDGRRREAECRDLMGGDVAEVADGADGEEQDENRGHANGG